MSLDLPLIECEVSTVNLESVSGTEVNLSPVESEVSGVSEPTVGLVVPRLEAEVSPVPVKMPVSGIASASIIKYGLGLSSDYSSSGGIKKTFDFEASGEIPSPTVGDPVNPYALHIGQGSILFTWEPAAGAHTYEIWASSSEVSSYTLAYEGIQDNRFIMRNVPLGSSFYFRVVAIHVTGERSNAVQVKKGKINKSSQVLKVKGIAGSVIPQGSVFSTVNSKTGSLISYQADSEITIQ